MNLRTYLMIKQASPIFPGYNRYSVRLTPDIQQIINSAAPTPDTVLYAPNNTMGGSNSVPVKSIIDNILAAKNSTSDPRRRAQYDNLLSLFHETGHSNPGKPIDPMRIVLPPMGEPTRTPVNQNLTGSKVNPFKTKIRV